MELPGLLVTGGLSVAASVVTAYLTARLQGRNERRKWQRELALPQAERQASNPDVAQTVAQHYATAYVITPDREKYFLMPGTTSSIGRENTSSDIRLSSPARIPASRHLRSTDHDVFLIDVGSTRLICQRRTRRSAEKAKGRGYYPHRPARTGGLHGVSLHQGAVVASHR
jgi:hypothetical protein